MVHSTVKKNQDKKAAGGAQSLMQNGSLSEQGWFARIAFLISHWAGRPAAFLLAAAVVIVWAVSGPLFGFSDTWQLVINTGTTVITFLMVFLIQATQNRDTAAMQVKLAEIIVCLRGADNTLATAEDLPDEDLEQLHRSYKKRADETLASLHKRRREGKAG